MNMNMNVDYLLHVEIQNHESFELDENIPHIHHPFHERRLT